MSSSSPPRRRFHDAGLVLAGNSLGLAFSFLAGLVAARVFEPSVRGEYAMLTTVSAFVSVLAGLGFAEAVIYFYGRGEAGAQRTATSIVLVNGAIVLLVACAAFAVTPWLAERYFPVGGRIAAWVAVGAGLLAILQRNASAFLQARRDFALASGAQLLQPLLFFAALAALGAAGGGFPAAVLAFGASFALPAGLLLAPLLRLFSARSLDAAYLARAARFSGKSYVNVALGQLNYRVDLFIIGALLPDLAELADYHIAATLAGLLWVLPDAYATAIYPRLASLRGERERSAEAVAACRTVLLPVLVLALGLALAAPLLIPWLFGARYAGAVPLTLLLLPGAIAMSVSKVLSRYFLSGDRQQLYALAMAAGVVVDVIALLVLLPRWGVAAASVAASAAYLASLACASAAFLLGGEPRREDFRAFPAHELGVARRGVEAVWRRVRGGREPKPPDAAR